MEKNFTQETTMDFSLSPEHQMSQKMVRDFVQKEIAPVIKEYDRKQEPIPFMLRRMGELGILGIPFPVRYGGQGMDYLAWGLACEELEAMDTHLRVVMSVHTGLCGMTLFQWGTEDKSRSSSCRWQRAKRSGAALSPRQAWARTWRRCGPPPNGTGISTS